MQTTESIGDHLRETKHKTEDAPYDKPGYITKKPYRDGSRIVVEGTTSNGRETWTHRFRDPEEWTDEWDLVRLVELSDYDWNEETFDSEFIIGKSVPLIDRNGNYKIDVPDKPTPTTSRIKQFISTIAVHVTRDNLLTIMWMALNVGLLCLAVVVIL